MNAMFEHRFVQEGRTGRSTAAAPIGPITIEELRAILSIVSHQDR